ncbi:MAG: hydrogenase maturation protease [Actinomycetota bacterium]|nr:hydrogenase maturation protease [Actinomycetota bacterium]
MTDPILVAGLGNIFLGDDGFGVEVARRLASENLPDHVKVEDIGIRGVHLAYEMLEDYKMTILVDTVSRGDPPGTIYVIQHEPEDAHSAAVDAHSMSPDSVLALLDTLGGKATNVLIVGCEPADLEEGIGLSDVVSAAVEEAVQVVCELVEQGPAPAGQSKDTVGMSELWTREEA